MLYLDLDYCKDINKCIVFVLLRSLIIRGSLYNFHRFCLEILMKFSHFACLYWCKLSIYVGSLRSCYFKTKWKWRTVWKPKSSPYILYYWRACLILSTEKVCITLVVKLCHCKINVTMKLRLQFLLDMLDCHTVELHGFLPHIVNIKYEKCLLHLAFFSQIIVKNLKFKKSTSSSNNKYNVGNWRNYINKLKLTPGRVDFGSHGIMEVAFSPRRALRLGWQTAIPEQSVIIMHITVNNLRLFTLLINNI